MDFVEEALLVAKAAGVPVKVVWTREEDLQYDYYRPGNATLLEGGLDAEGRLVAWRQKVAVPPIFERVFPGMIKDGIDLAAIDGLRELEYEIPNVAVEYVRVDTPVPVGFWRSVGNSHNGFTVECFVDELARAAGKDPLEFRLGLLKNHPRAARVVRLAAEKAGLGRAAARRARRAGSPTATRSTAAWRRWRRCRCARRRARSSSTAWSAPWTAASS